MKDIAAAGGGGSPPDPVGVDAILMELRALAACSEEFAARMQSLMAETIHPKPLPASAAESLHSGAFWTSLRELQGHYVTLESYYMEQCLAKAIAIDSVLEACFALSYFVLKSFLLCVG